MEVSKCWKMAEFPKISIKMKYCKTFYEGQTVSCVKEIIQPLQHPSPQLDKILLRLWNKCFLMEIYRNIQTFAFKVLQEHSSWASRNDTVQMFFSDTKQKKWLRFSVLSRQHIIFNIKWVEVLKMIEVFWAKLYRKMSELFC